MFDLLWRASVLKEKLFALLLIVYFQSMNAYKTNSLPTLILIKSQALYQYLESTEVDAWKPSETVRTDVEEIKKEAVIEVKESIIDNPTPIRKSLKDDYQKNITINVVKCCIKEMLSKNYQKLLQKRCEKKQVSYEKLIKFIEPILKEVVLSLGDLKQLLTSGDEQEIGLKRIFCWFLEWYLRNKYIFYLLNEGKMSFKQRYIEYKNKYILYLLSMVREEWKKGIAPPQQN